MKKEIIIEVNKKTIEGALKIDSSLVETCLFDTIINKDILAFKYILKLTEDVPVDLRIKLKENLIYPLKVEDIKNNECQKDEFWFDQGIGIVPCVEIETTDFKKELEEELKYKINQANDWFKKVLNFSKKIKQVGGINKLPADMQLEIKNFFEHIEEYMSEKENQLNKLKIRLNELN